jgi:hypothetical protein
MKMFPLGLPDTHTLSAMFAPQWWAPLVGALHVHPHEHSANFPEIKDRGTSGKFTFRLVFIENCSFGRSLTRLPKSQKNSGNLISIREWWAQWWAHSMWVN